MRNKITYTCIVDYLLPNIKLNEPPPKTTKPLGRYGIMHKSYLQEHRPIFYNQLLLSERLFPLCREIDEAAATRLSTISDRKIAHEIILSELIYS